MQTTTAVEAITSCFFCAVPNSLSLFHPFACLRSRCSPLPRKETQQPRARSPQIPVVRILFEGIPTQPAPGAPLQRRQKQTLNKVGFSPRFHRCCATMEQPTSNVGKRRRRRRLHASPCWSRAVQAGLVGVLGSVSCRRVEAALSDGEYYYCMCHRRGGTAKPVHAVTMQSGELVEWMNHEFLLLHCCWSVRVDGRSSSVAAVCDLLRPRPKGSSTCVDIACSCCLQQSLACLRNRDTTTGRISRRKEIVWRCANVEQFSSIHAPLHSSAAAECSNVESRRVCSLLIWYPWAPQPAVLSSCVQQHRHLSQHRCLLTACAPSSHFDR